MQAEYATDIVFKRQEYLQATYSELIATAIHTVKPDDIATFFGHKLDNRYQWEVGNNYHVRLEGSTPDAVKRHGSTSPRLRRVPSPALLGPGIFKTLVARMTLRFEIFP